MINQPRQNVVLLTSGGIAPGHNAGLAEAIFQLKQRGHRILGSLDGWDGLLDEGKMRDLTDTPDDQLRAMRLAPSTVLGSSRTKIKEESYDRVRRVIEKCKIDGGVILGGDDTIFQANALHEAGVLRSNALPKTVDNDVHGTDLTYGFRTAANVTSEQIARMRDDARAMHGVAVVQCMGRRAGWIALHGGTAGGADMILIPEFPIPEDRLLARILELQERSSREGRKGHVVIAIAEGYYGEDKTHTDGFGNGELIPAADTLGKLVKGKLRLKVMPQTVGYGSRNGPPTEFDAHLAGRMGAVAGGLAAEGHYGYMASLQGNNVVAVPLSEGKGGRHVPEDLYDPETMSMRLVPKNILDVIADKRVQVNGVLQK